MPTEKTAHELGEDRAEYERTWRLEAERLRQRLLRECPAGRFLNRKHLMVMVGDGHSSNRAHLALGYLALHGARALGLDMTEAAAVLGLNAGTAARFIARDVWWDAPAAMLDDVPAEFRASVIGSH